MIEHTNIVDVLAIGAHPDDVELGCGGTLAKLMHQGRRVAVLDLTCGEMGSRGDSEERLREAADAAAIMGISDRVNARLPDGGLINIPEQKMAIVTFIRRYRPTVALALMAPDRHPDHIAAHQLCRDACYLAGLRRVETGQEPFRPGRMIFYHPYMDYGGMPQAIMDISEHFSTKMAAVRAYASQFHNPAYSGPDTFISTKEFWDSIEIRARFWGNRIGVTYGEPFYMDGPVPLKDFPGL